MSGFILLTISATTFYGVPSNGWHGTKKHIDSDSPTKLRDTMLLDINTLQPRQYGHHFANDTFESIFVSEKMLEFRFKFHWSLLPRVWLTKSQHWLKKMAWCRPGDKPLSEPSWFSLLTQLCIPRPQWVNTFRQNGRYFTRDIFKCIFMNEKCILMQISLGFLQLAMSHESLR